MPAPRLPARSVLARLGIGLAVALVAILAAAVPARAQGLGIPLPGQPAVVPPALPGRLVIVNDSQYELTGLKVAGVQLLGLAQVVPLDRSIATQVASGFHAVEVSFGFRDPPRLPRSLFKVIEKVEVLGIGTTTLRIRPLHVRQLLSGFSNSKRWVGTYHDVFTGPGIRTYTFYSGGSWTLRDGNALIASGSVTQVEWADLALSVRFKLVNAAGGEVLTLDMPFDRFRQRNGPPTFPEILYVRQ